MTTDNVLRQALHAAADASDRLVGGSGEHYRKFADGRYDESYKHVLLTPATCNLTHHEGHQCPVCDGGLAVCANCSEFEAGLDNPCRPQPAKTDPHDDNSHGVYVLSSEPRDLTGIHDSHTCTLGLNGQPCEQCTAANSREHRMGMDEQALDCAMVDFVKSHGAEAFARKVDRFMAEKGIY